MDSKLPPEAIFNRFKKEMADHQEQQQIDIPENNRFYVETIPPFTDSAAQRRYFQSITNLLDENARQIEPKITARVEANIQEQVSKKRSKAGKQKGKSKASLAELYRRILSELVAKNGVVNPKNMMEAVEHWDDPIGEPPKDSVESNSVKVKDLVKKVSVKDLVEKIPVKFIIGEDGERVRSEDGGFLMYVGGLSEKNGKAFVVSLYSIQKFLEKKPKISN